MDDLEIISRFDDYLKVERGYSDYTVRNYIDDIYDFCDYLKTVGFKNLTMLKPNVTRYYLMYMNEKGYKEKKI